MAGERTARRVELPPHGVSTGVARRFVAQALVELGRPELEDSAVLAVSELVTNAVLHCRTPIDLTVRRLEDDAVRIDVGDLSPVVPSLREYGDLATTGRGLALVAAVVGELGVEPREVGKTVWFRLPRTAADTAAGGGDLLDLWPDPDADVDDAPARSAVLLALPVARWEAAHQHQDAALRELVLHRGTLLPGTTQAWAWYAAADTAHSDLSGAVDRARSAAGAQDRLDVTVPLDATLPQRVRALQQALRDADELAVQGRLLVDPSPREQVTLRDWCVAQVLGQAGGAPAVPWTGSA